MALVDFLVESPDWVKYFLFLSVLSADAGIEAFTGYGLLGSIIGTVVSSIFGVQGFIITSFQLLILAVIVPLVFWVLSMYSSE